MPEIVTAPLVLALVAVAAYLIGSIPFGIVITKALGLGDLRQIGSGNIGATNVLRTGNKRAAAATLVLDAAKGAVAVLLARCVVGAEDGAQLAGLAAFVGHLFPAWLNFKGGKGVATFLGTMLALAWPIGVACCLTWFVAAVLFRYSSLAALVATASSVLWVLLLGPQALLVLAALLAVLIFQRHTANIARLRAGTEPKIGKR